jgi:putative glycosyltransferase (TIGR04372 family)
MYKLGKIFFEKQKNRGLSKITYELFIRALSLLIFPFAYGLLSVIELIKPVRIGFLYHERLGHLALNTDLYLRRRHLGMTNKKETHIFFVYKPANNQLALMFSRELKLYNSEFFSKLFAPIGIFHTRFHLPMPFIGNEYHEFHSAPPQISFTDEERLKGANFTRSLGIGDNDWYVCFFARDNKYYKIYSPNTDTTFSDHRNSDVDSYILAAKFIVDSGGWVIRMGSCVEKSFNFKHPRVIDYAIDFRNDFADIYLSANAKLFVGTASGASDIAALFDVPFVGVNWVPIGYSPFAKNSIFIPKRLIKLDSGGQVPLRDQLTAFVGNQVSANIKPEETLDKYGWKFNDNTELEIAQAVEEGLNRVNNKFVHEYRYTEALIKIKKMIPSDNIYRKTKTPIASKMLLSMDLN